MTRKTATLGSGLISGLLIGAGLLAGCGSSHSTSATPTAITGRTASGDIPDTAVYITYTGQGYNVKYVEGWTIHRGPAAAVTISDKDSSEVVATMTSSNPVGAYASSNLGRLSQSSPKFHLVFMRNMNLPGGKAIRAQYSTLSPRDPVTLKRVPVVVDKYYIQGQGKLATVTLSTPKGVDNVDAFRLIAHSFTWH